MVFHFPLTSRKSSLELTTHSNPRPRQGLALIGSAHPFSRGSSEVVETIAVSYVYKAENKQGHIDAHFYHLGLNNVLGTSICTDQGRQDKMTGLFPLLCCQSLPFRYDIDKPILSRVRRNSGPSKISLPSLMIHSLQHAGGFPTRDSPQASRLHLE